MRLPAVAIVAAVTLSGGVLYAQSKGIMHLIKPDKDNNKDKDKDKDDRDRDHGRDRDERAVRMCMSRRNFLDNEQKRDESYRSELAGIEAEMISVQRRLDDLKRQRDDARQNLTMQDRRYKAAQDAYKRECSADENCDSYENQADGLEDRRKNVDTALDGVRDDVKQNREDVMRLQQRIEPLQREYNEKHCNNLVPGETEQVVIDRCMAIFSDWNRLQGDLNRQNNRLPDLRSRYEQLSSDLRSLEQRAAGYQSYLERNCSQSSRIAKMRDYNNVEQRSKTVGQELDGLVNDITRLRGVKITVNAQ